MSDTSAAPVILGDNETEGSTTITVAPVIVVPPPAEPAAPVEEPAAALEVAEIVAAATPDLGPILDRLDALETIVYAEPVEEIEDDEIEEIAPDPDAEPNGVAEGEPGGILEPEAERVEPNSKKVHWMFRKFSDWRN